MSKRPTRPKPKPAPKSAGFVMPTRPGKPSPTDPPRRDLPTPSGYRRKAR